MATGGVHLITGAALGTLAPGRPSAFAAGVCSHALLDMLPHRDYHARAAHLVDLALAATVCAVALRRKSAHHRVRVIFGAVGAIAPDLENADLVLFGGKLWRRRFPTHSGLLPHPRGPWSTTVIGYSASLFALTLAARRRRSGC